MIPSPHCWAMQSPFCKHTQPGSISHAVEQPSPSTALKSSHSSSPATTPSPQSEAVQPSPAVSQTQPGSISQVLEQPSSLSALPSSHSSSSARSPSPQTSGITTGASSVKSSGISPQLVQPISGMVGGPDVVSSAHAAMSEKIPAKRIGNVRRCCICLVALEGSLESQSSV